MIAKIFKIVMWVLGVVFLALVLTVAGVALFFPAEKVKSLVVEKAEAAGVVVDFAAASFHWGLPLGFVIDDFKFHTVEGVDFGGYAARGGTQKLVISLDWWHSLLSLSLHSKVWLTAPDIHARAVIVPDSANTPAPTSDAPADAGAAAGGALSPRAIKALMNLKLSIEITDGRLTYEQPDLKVSLRDFDFELSAQGLRREMAARYAFAMEPSAVGENTIAFKSEGGIVVKALKIEPPTLEIKNLKASLSSIALSGPTMIVENGAFSFSLPTLTATLDSEAAHITMREAKAEARAVSLITIDEKNERTTFAEVKTALSARGADAAGPLEGLAVVVNNVSLTAAAKWMRAAAQTIDLAPWPLKLTLSDMTYNQASTAFALGTGTATLAAYEVGFTASGTTAPQPHVAFQVLPATLALETLTPFVHKAMPDVTIAGEMKLAEPLTIEYRAAPPPPRAKDAPAPFTVTVDNPDFQLNNFVFKSSDIHVEEPPLSAALALSYEHPVKRVKLDTLTLKREGLVLPISGDFHLEPRVKGTIIIGAARFPFAETPRFVLSKMPITKLSGHVAIEKPITITFENTTPPTWSANGQIGIREVGFSHEKADVQGSDTTIVLRRQTVNMDGSLARMTVKSEITPPLPVDKTTYEIVAAPADVQIPKASLQLLGGVFTLSRARYDVDKRVFGLDRIRYRNPDVNAYIEWYKPAYSGVIGGELDFRGEDISQRLDAQYDIVKPSLRGRGDAKIDKFVWSTLPLEAEINNFIRGALSRVPVIDAAVRDVPRFVKTDFSGGINVCEMDYRLSGEIAEITRLVIESPEGQLRGRGTIHIYDMTMDMDMELEAYGVGGLLGSGDIRDIVADARGHLVIPFQLTGTLQKPSFRFDAAAFLGPIQNRAAAVAKRKLEADAKKKGAELIKEAVPEDKKEGAKQILKRLFR